MTRCIKYFDKISEEYVGMHELPTTISLNDLTEFLGARVPEYDPMLYYCYEIYITDRPFYEKILNINLDFDKYDYFLECDA
ncbi:DUF7683 domain-containing protein [Treponema pedis]|uniref:DUF7683 domain-containing protein n=3 Tax=Treponema pedis TaxID=409322 RepID=UPI000465A9CA|nr:hypothetical protein [Treponema pedis]QSI04802.1 hypothetical protein DYQ05_07615 [Treponema pedis]